MKKPRYRLRHELTDHELEDGRFLVGRRSDCDLVLDDALISRVHAILEVIDGAIWIEDNGSRNGVRINGAPLLQRTKLSHFDNIVLGTQHLVVLESGRSSLPPKNTYCRKCGQGIEMDDLFCSRCGAPALSTAQSRTEKSAQLFTEEEQDSQETEETETGDTFSFVERLAAKSMASGHYAAAERMLERLMMAQLQSAMKGASIPPNHFQRTTTHALSLAESLRAARWLDWLFQIHTEARTLISAELIDRLFEVVHALRYSETRPIARYLATIEEAGLAADPSSKFIVQRLRSLEKVIRA